MVAAFRVKPGGSDPHLFAQRRSFLLKARVERIISGEEQPASGHGSNAMPVWGPVFSQVDNDQDLGRVRIDNLTRYLISIQAK